MKDNSVMKNVLEERESFVSGDILLDEQIMNEEDSHIIVDDDEHIGREANRQTASQNMYKFKNQDQDRPKTSNGTTNTRNNHHTTTEERISHLDKIS